MNPVGHDVNIYDSLFITSYLSGCQCDHQSILQVIPITPISDEFFEWFWLVSVGSTVLLGTAFYRANPRYRFSWGWLIEVIMDKLNWHGHPNNVFIQDNPWKIISNRFYGAK